MPIALSQVHPLPPRRSAPRRRRPAFTFTEVMFAVIILGIGFVMIAAILPVAIQQTKDSADATTASAAGQAMIQSLSLDQTSNQKLFSATYAHPAAPPDRAIAEYFGDPNNSMSASLGVAPDTHYTVAQQWSAIRGSLIWPNDTRFGCVPIYIRGLTNPAAPVLDPVATLIVIVTQCRAADSPTRSDTSHYDPSTDLIFTPGAPLTPATLQPKHLQAKFNASAPGQPQSITFTGAISGDISCVGEGCFVVISGAASPAVAGAVGNVLRLGPVLDASSNTWSLNSDFDMTAMPASDRPDGTNTYDVLVVGKALKDPTSAFNATSNPYAGGVQDVAVYKTLVPVH